MTTDHFTFTVNKTDGSARIGEIRMPRGVIRTPAFMPVGTAATVKAMYPDQVKALGADVVLGNTYHLMLRPGAERVARLGGLHHFMNWPYPILTDSGGFQVMSLSALRKVEETGVTFQSHIDGSTHVMTPERSIEIQGLLGSDIQMQLDECVRLPAAHDVTEKAMRLSLRWAERCRVAFGEQPGKAMFGIVQGGAVERLRIESAGELAAMPLKGYAIGGLAVGEPQDVMLRMIETVEPHMPKGKPRYLMGVGTPDDIVESVRHGIEQLLEGLSAPPRPFERDPGHDAADMEQPGLLSGAHGRAAQGDHRRTPRGLRRRGQGGLGQGRAGRRGRTPWPHGQRSDRGDRVTAQDRRCRSGP